MLGAQASARNSQSAPAAAPSTGAQVPTAVESGLSDQQQSRPLLPLLALLFGLGTTAVALTRRRKDSA